MPIQYNDNDLPASAVRHLARRRVLKENEEQSRDTHYNWPLNINHRYRYLPNKHKRGY
jgi:hypothetical protein